MINIYIDESGTKNLKDKNQPIYLLSAILIDTSIHTQVEDELKKLIDYSKNKINTTLSFSFEKNSYTKNRVDQILKYLEKITCKNFEIHTTELVRGENIFSILSNKDRFQILNNGISIIKTYNLRSITIACKKIDFLESNQDLSIKDKEINMHENIVNILTEEIEKYLKEINKKGFIFSDEQNFTIENYLKPSLRNSSLNFLNPVIIENKSHENIMLQLADIVAYTSNLSIRNELNLLGDRSKDSASKIEDFSENNKMFFINDLVLEEN